MKMLICFWAILLSSVIADLVPFYGWFFCQVLHQFRWICAILICLVPVPGLWAVFLCPGSGHVLSMVVVLGYPVCGV